MRISFFFNDTATTEIYTLSLHDALPISTANADAIVLNGKDLDALPEDPEDLAAALQALAGPSAGPNGGQIYIDGFTGGDRKSTRLNSSHANISHAVFCFEKKTRTISTRT